MTEELTPPTRVTRGEIPRRFRTSRFAVASRLLRPAGQLFPAATSPLLRQIAKMRSRCSSNSCGHRATTSARRTSDNKLAEIASAFASPPSVPPDFSAVSPVSACPTGGAFQIRGTSAYPRVYAKRREFPLSAFRLFRLSGKDLRRFAVTRECNEFG